MLVVEDNVDAADSLSLLLRLYGHEVQVARTGPTALEMASASRPDVVLLDIGLPGMDGYQVAKRLRERPEFKDVMMCALTGFTPSEADRQRQQETGFDHYLSSRSPWRNCSSCSRRSVHRRRDQPDGRVTDFAETSDRSRAATPGRSAGPVRRCFSGVQGYNEPCSAWNPCDFKRVNFQQQLNQNRWKTR